MGPFGMLISTQFRCLGRFYSFPPQGQPYVNIASTRYISKNTQKTLQYEKINVLLDTRKLQCEMLAMPLNNRSLTFWLHLIPGCTLST